MLQPCALKDIVIPTGYLLPNFITVEKKQAEEQDIFCFERRSVKDMWTDYAKSHIRDYPDSSYFTTTEQVC